MASVQGHRRTPTTLTTIVDLLTELDRLSTTSGSVKHLYREGAVRPELQFPLCFLLADSKTVRGV